MGLIVEKSRSRSASTAGWSTSSNSVSWTSCFCVRIRVSGAGPPSRLPASSSCRISLAWLMTPDGSPLARHLLAMPYGWKKMKSNTAAASMRVTRFNGRKSGR